MNQNCEREVVLGEDDIFFSTTDKKGYIISSNDTFVRISGYEKQELLGANHNIIRHPDMPKSVFRLLWNFLKEGRSLAAYVKNRTKAGNYYWVLAFAFPIEERYLSIRIKPDSETFDKVKELYTRLCAVEEQDGVEAGYMALQEAITSLGFGDYEEFMTHFLIEEFGLRSNKEASKGAGAIFGSILKYQNLKDSIKESANELRHSSREILFMALNTAIASAKLSCGGETFSVLAARIGEHSRSNRESIGEINSMSAHITRMIQNISLDAAAMLLQESMIEAFSQELTKSKDAQKEADLEALATLCAGYRENALELFCSLGEDFAKVEERLEMIAKSMTFLEYINVYGKIESSLLKEQAGHFRAIFMSLKATLEDTFQKVRFMEARVEELQKEAERNYRALL